MKRSYIAVTCLSALLGLLSGCAGQPQRMAADPPAAASEQVIAAAAEAELPPPFESAEDADLAKADGPVHGAPPPDTIVAPTHPPETEADTAQASATGPRIKRAAKPGLHESELGNLVVPAPDDKLLEEFPAAAVPLAEPDLWTRIRSGFTLGRDNPRVQSVASWYVQHPRYFERVTEQAEPYLHYIVNEVEQRGMPSEIALLPVIESAFQPFAYSTSRAAGLWQFIPDTGRRFGLKLNWWYDGRRDVVASTQAALDYLQYLHDTFDGDWLLALAAYNSGEGTVLRAIRENERLGKPTDFWSLRLPRETQDYVPRLLAVSAIIAAPAEQGIALKPIPDESYITTVEVDTQLDLAVAAKLADMSVGELHRLNPAFNRWATDPDGPHLLLLPADKAAAFAAGLAELPPEQRVRWLRHRVRRGETLNQIATRYHTTLRVLRRLNKLDGNTVRNGQYLLVPVAPKDLVELPAQGIEIPAEQIHTVGRGETLWSLARRYKVTAQELAAWNSLNKRAELRVGQKLVLRTSVPSTLTSSSLIDTTRKIIYTVRQGDSLAMISKRYSVSVSQLKKWNDIKKKAPRLKAGQRITVYVDMMDDAG